MLIVPKTMSLILQISNVDTNCKVLSVVNI